MIIKIECKKFASLVQSASFVNKASMIVESCKKGRGAQWGIRGGGQENLVYTA